MTKDQKVYLDETRDDSNYLIPKKYMFQKGNKAIEHELRSVSEMLKDQGFTIESDDVMYVTPKLTESQLKGKNIIVQSSIENVSFHLCNE